MFSETSPYDQPINKNTSLSQHLFVTWRKRVVCNFLSVGTPLIQRNVISWTMDGGLSTVIHWIFLLVEIVQIKFNIITAVAVNILIQA